MVCFSNISLISLTVAWEFWIRNFTLLSRPCVYFTLQTTSLMSAKSWGIYWTILNVDSYGQSICLFVTTSRPVLEFTTPPNRWIRTACSHFGWPFVSIECRNPALHPYCVMLRHMFEVFFYRCNALYESEIKVYHFPQNWTLCTYVYSMSWFLITDSKWCFSKTKPEVTINRLSPPLCQRERQE